MRNRRLLFLVPFAVAACTSAAVSDSESSEGDLSVREFVKLLTNNVDRSKPDPSNEWAKKEVGLGEENVLENEDKMFDEFADKVREIQTINAHGGDKDRGFHSKPNICLLGEMRVDPKNLPEDARVGLFAKKETFPSWIRFSDGTGFRQADKRIDVRGLAFKVANVPGKNKLFPGEADAQTQDFLMTDGPITPACDAAHFVNFGFAMAQSKDTDGENILGKLEAMGKVGGFLNKSENLRTLDYLIHTALRNTQKHGSTLGSQFWSGGAIALGLGEGDPMTAKPKRAIKFTAKGGVLKNGVDCVAQDREPNKEDDDYFRTDLNENLKKGPICAEMFVQFQDDAVKQPIEDTSVEWKTPFVKVATVVVGMRDLESDNVKLEEARCNGLAFTPWHSLPEHRPLGNIMRARLKAYSASATGRTHGREPRVGEAL